MSRASFVSRYGKWAVVTGASEGIGREFAHQLASAGVNLVLVARRGPALQALATELQRSHGIESRVIVADLSEHRAVHEMAAATIDLDVGLLVAAAGFGASGPLISSSLETESEMVDVNISAVLALSWHFGRRFASRGRGALVLMSSLLAFQGVPRAANYAATKAYVQTLAEGLRVELAPHGVDVIASAPGPIHSGFAARANMRMSMTLEPAVVAQVTLQALGRKTTVRPGWLSKVLEWSLATLPRWGRVTVINQVMKAMTAHQPTQLSASGHRAS